MHRFTPLNKVDKKSKPKAIRPQYLTGFKAKVIPGQGLGKRLGFPTANLDAIKLPIDYGVYLVKVTLGDKIMPGLMHWGPKKTFDGAGS